MKVEYLGRRRRGRNSAPVAGPPYVTSNLINWWKFDDGSGDTAVDYVNGNNIRLGGVAGPDAQDPLWGTGPRRLISDGADDYARALNFPAHPSSFSINATTLVHAVPSSFGAILHWFDTSLRNILHLRVDQTTGLIRAVAFDAASPVTIHTAVVGTRFHVGISVDSLGATVFCYINGILVASPALTISVARDATTLIDFFRRSGSFSPGYAPLEQSDIRIHSVSLNAAQQLAEYNAAKSVFTDLP